MFFAGNLVPRGFWEREANPKQSVQRCCDNRQHVRENATFCGQNLVIYQDIWTLPWLLPLERFVLRFLAFLDNPYASVAANCSNADHVLDAMCWNTWWH